MARTRESVYFGDVDGLGAFTPLTRLELHPLTLGQRAESVHRDVGVVYEDIIATVVGNDESVAFFLVEPFDRTGGQLPILQLRNLAGWSCKRPLDDE